MNKTIKLAVGEHTEFMSKNGIEYVVFNIRGQMFIYKKNSVRTNRLKPTKEIIAAIELG